MTTHNPETIVERRTELLKLEGDGFSRPDIEKQLSQKYQVTVRTVSRDFQIRAEWQPSITHLTDKKQAFYSVLNRYEQIYQKASFTYLHSKNESVTIATLRVMLDVLTKIRELANITAEEGEPTEYTIRWNQGQQITDALKEQEEFTNWTNENLSQEEKEALTITSRAYIRYSLAKSNKGNSLH
ncbi:hypothetical protein ACFLRN_02840 [Thermoproteota archaeon]